jgi:hypothetical protein
MGTRALKSLATEIADLFQQQLSSLLVVQRFSDFSEDERHAYEKRARKIAALRSELNAIIENQARRKHPSGLRSGLQTVAPPS